MAITPIWKDTYITVPTEYSPINYRIEIEGTGIWYDDEGVQHVSSPAIFYGKAWAKPSSETNTFEININKICQDYLSNEIGDFRSVIGMEGRTQGDSLKTFNVYNDVTNVLLSSFDFIFDWSYDDSVDYTTTPTDMSHPINHKGADGMYYFHTQFNGSQVITNVNILPFHGYVEEECTNAQYALYYLNRYGGWDSFLIEGSVTRRDSYNRFNMEKAYDNRTIEFGTRTYNNQITSSYELHTGWLTEEQSYNLSFNLLSSTRIYLHKLNTDEVLPVVVNDAEATYKNRNNSGRKLLNYTINVITSQKQNNLNK